MYVDADRALEKLRLGESLDARISNTRRGQKNQTGPSRSVLGDDDQKLDEHRHLDVFLFVARFAKALAKDDEILRKLPGLHARGFVVVDEFAMAREHEFLVTL